MHPSGEQMHSRHKSSLFKKEILRSSGRIYLHRANSKVCFMQHDSVFAA
ncbi:hypothetical protein HMPREF1990_00049 [Porphyromonas gingivalis W4087]|nr:hypothetical protein HMPREF1990_00049 [Porphyromonas gingivalis W4087]